MLLIHIENKQQSYCERGAVRSHAPLEQSSSEGIRSPKPRLKKKRSVFSKKQKTKQKRSYLDDRLQAFCEGIKLGKTGSLTDHYLQILHSTTNTEGDGNLCCGEHA